MARRTAEKPERGSISLGYKLSSEEHSPADLVRFARMAEDAGFTFAMISDHYHPWTDRQGQSAFVWSVLGAIAEATERLNVGTAVTCPSGRIHPAIIAQAAATTAALMPGRFFLGVGTGENLNEHIVGRGWPETEIRQARLEEAVEVDPPTLARGPAELPRPPLHGGECAALQPAGGATATAHRRRWTARRAASGTTRRRVGGNRAQC